MRASTIVNTDEQAALARARPTATAWRSRRRCRCATPNKVVRALVPRHGREGRRHRLRRRRTGTKASAVGLRHAVSTCGKRPTSCAARSSPIAASTSPASRCTSRRSCAPTRRPASGCCRRARSSTSACTTDARSKEVDRRTIDVNKWSSAEWTWDVPAEAHARQLHDRGDDAGTEKPEGNDVTERRVTTREWLQPVNGSFLVAAYRKPDFRVDTTLTADAGSRRHDAQRVGRRRGICSAASMAQASASRGR